jgi:uncharacterized protein involved in response to NO
VATAWRARRVVAGGGDDERDRRAGHPVLHPPRPGQHRPRPARPWLDRACLLGSVALPVSYVLGLGHTTTRHGGTVLALAVLHAVRLALWHDRGLWRLPLLWSLHLPSLADPACLGWLCGIRVSRSTPACRPTR